MIMRVCESNSVAERQASKVFLVTLILIFFFAFEWKGRHELYQLVEDLFGQSYLRVFLKEKNSKVQDYFCREIKCFQEFLQKEGPIAEHKVFSEFFIGEKM